MSNTVHHGVVHGNTIQLDAATGLADGQAVVVTIKPHEKKTDASLEERMRRSFGAWSDDPEGLEEYLRWNREQRKIERPEIAP
jgi:hypothetical protein